MNLDTLLTRGQLPWRPSPAVRHADIWHEYDGPTAGILELDDGQVLFTAIGDREDRLSVWAYRSLTDEEHSRLSAVQVSSVEELNELIDGAFAGQEAVLALADEMKLDQWSRASVGPGGLLLAAAGFLRQILESLEARRSPGALFQSRLAATRELVDA